MVGRPGLRVRLAALVALGATVVLTTAALFLYHDVTSGVSEAITTELEDLRNKGWQIVKNQ